MSENQEPQQNYFLFIPATVANDPSLSDSEKMLFGRIAGLSNDKGFCWASNKYLGDLCGVTPDETSKRIKKLKDLGYLHVDTKKKGFAWYRKIYPNFNHEGFKRTVREDHTDSSTGSYELHTNKEDNNTRKQQTEAAAVFACLLPLKIAQEEKEWITRNHVEASVEHAVKYVTTPGVEIKTSLVQCLKWACKTQPKIKKTAAAAKEENQKYLKSLRHLDMKEYRDYRIDIGVNDITFIHIKSATPGTIFTVDDHDFKNKVYEHAKKIGFV